MRSSCHHFLGSTKHYTKHAFLDTLPSLHDLSSNFDQFLNLPVVIKSLEAEAPCTFLILFVGSAHSDESEEIHVTKYRRQDVTEYRRQEVLRQYFY